MVCWHSPVSKLGGITSQLSHIWHIASLHHISFLSSPCAYISPIHSLTWELTRHGDCDVLATDILHLCSYRLQQNLIFGIWWYFRRYKRSLNTHQFGFWSFAGRFVIVLGGSFWSVNKISPYSDCTSKWALSVSPCVSSRDIWQRLITAFRSIAFETLRVQSSLAQITRLTLNLFIHPATLTITQHHFLRCYYS